MISPVSILNYVHHFISGVFANTRIHSFHCSFHYIKSLPVLKHKGKGSSSNLEKRRVSIALHMLITNNVHVLDMTFSLFIASIVTHPENIHPALTINIIKFVMMVLDNRHMRSEK